MPCPAPTHPLYPETAARRSRLAVSDGHTLQLYEWGNPDGLPALLLHGGPGSGLSLSLARCLDPQRYRIIGLDQRGAGLSTPAGGVEGNNTAALLADLRALRLHLGITRWLVVAGSWGATLALLHAADAPSAVSGLLLRGTFLARREDVLAFFAAEPAGFGDGWAPWRAAAAQHGHDLLAELDQVMQHGSADAQAALARCWWRFEQAMDGANPTEPADASPLLPRYRVQAHYLHQDCGLADRPLLDRLADVPTVPTLLLHGELDHICPLAGAQAVANRLPAARLRCIAGAGHAPHHPPMSTALVQALDQFAASGQFEATPAP